MNHVEPICPECGQEMISPEGCHNCRAVHDHLQELYWELVELARQVAERE